MMSLFRKPRVSTLDVFDVAQKQVVGRGWESVQNEFEDVHGVIEFEEEKKPNISFE